MNKSHVFGEQWYRFGILYISDITGENKEVLSYNEFDWTLQYKSFFSEYMSVQMAIPIEGRKVIREKQKSEFKRYTLTIYGKRSSIQNVLWGLMDFVRKMTKPQKMYFFS